MNTIRILLVDDNSAFLEAAARFLAADAGIEIVGLLSSGHEVIEQFQQLQPDVIILDIAMPNINGLEVARSIKAHPDAPRVIILTLHDNPEYRSASQAARADGFVPKSEFGAQLIPMIHSLFAAQPGTNGFGKIH